MIPGHFVERQIARIALKRSKFAVLLVENGQPNCRNIYSLEIIENLM